MLYARNLPYKTKRQVTVSLNHKNIYRAQDNLKKINNEKKVQVFFQLIREHNCFLLICIFDAILPLQDPLYSKLEVVKLQAENFGKQIDMDAGEDEDVSLNVDVDFDVAMDVELDVDVVVDLM